MGPSTLLMRGGNVKTRIMLDNTYMLYLLLLTFGAVAAQTTPEKRHTLCGIQLAKIHALYCYGVATQPDAFGVNSESSSEDIDEDSVVVTKLPERFAYQASRTAAAKLQEHSKSLVEKCCLKPCQILELISHC